MRRRFPSPLLLSAALIAGCNGVPLEEGPTPGASLLRLEPPARLGAPQRPVVIFDHDQHTKALSGQACTRCHRRGSDGALSLLFDRANDLASRDARMDHYHRKCIGCHTDLEAERGRPLPRECAACHGRATSAGATWRPLAYDRSLHVWHVMATGSEACKACHHVYDEARGKLVYRKGTEAVCRQCHGERASKGPGGRPVPSLRQAAHASCVRCHQREAAAKQKAGPVECAGCHAAARQRAIARIDPVERLSAGQKDLIRLRGGNAGVVPFDHKGHEAAAGFCSGCHHRTTRGCGTCHKRSTGPSGGGISLERAHHDGRSERSCVGCHQRRTEHRECAGCHGQLTGRPGRSCKACHGAPEAAVALVPLPASSEAFPDRVTIKVLARQYQPSVFEHRKIVGHLDRAARASKLAARFHGRVETLCAGCHHHSPAGQRPPPCASCHGSKADATRDRPALKAAYHRQCLGCHQRMKLKQGCTDCHAVRGTEVKR